MELKDCNGNILVDGDNVIVQKDLPVKGSSQKIKRGTVIKKIRVGSDSEHFDCKINGSAMAVKACFVKKS